MALGQAEVEAMVARFLERVREKVPVAAAYLYGSQVSGRPDSDSDIDVAVISPAFGEDVQRDLVLLSEACLPDATLIEAVPFSVDEHDHPPRGSFLREVIRHGRRVA